MPLVSFRNSHFKFLAAFLAFLSSNFLYTIPASAQGYVWANNGGGNNSDAGEAIAKDEAGNIYVTGYFGSGTSHFGTITLTGTGIQNVFVAKYDHLTGECMWAVKADGFLFPNGMSINSAGDIFITGFLNGTNVFGPITVTATGIYDVFAAKMDSNGTWQWVATAGGIGAGMQDYGIGIVADEEGNSYVTGIFANTIHFGNITLTSNGNDDVFVAKLNTSGAWQWSRQFGSTYIDDGNGISISPSGSLYCTGAFSGSVTFGSTTLTSYGGSEDIYVCKMDTAGNVEWAVKAGGSTPDYGNAIVRDEDGSLFVTGWYSTTATFGTSSVTTLGGNEVFVARCDSNGIWKWVASGGTAGIDIAYDIGLDDEKNSYLTGYVNAGYPVIFGNDTIMLASNYSDVFVAKCDSNGTWQWLSVSGDSSWDVGYGIVVDGCNQYVTGYFTLTVDFDSIPLTAAGSTSDAYIGQYSDCAGSLIAFSVNDPTICEKFCVNFFDQSLNDPTAWLWLFPGGIPVSSTDQDPANICYNAAGTYDVTLITTNATGNDTLLLPDYITVNATPPAPIITQTGNVLTSSPAFAYQWQLNAVDIAGATSQTYVATQSGLYTIIISDSLGCVNAANLDVVITGIEDESSSAQISIFPNPSQGNFTIDFNDEKFVGDVSISIVNGVGQSVEVRQLSIQSAAKEEFQLNNVANGVYFIEIKSGSAGATGKVLIAR